MNNTPKNPVSCNYGEKMHQLGVDRERPLILQSTRAPKHIDLDGYRNFDGFDINEELSRLRRALAGNFADRVNFTNTVIANIDEYLLRGGPLPKAWERADKKTPIDESSSVVDSALRELVDQTLQSPEGVQKLLGFAQAFLKDRLELRKAVPADRNVVVSRTCLEAILKILGKLAPR